MRRRNEPVVLTAAHRKLVEQSTRTGWGRPRTVPDQQVAEIVNCTLPKQPPHAAHWSTQSMTGAGGVSQETVRRIWRAFGLEPHCRKTFNLGNDRCF